MPFPKWREDDEDEDEFSIVKVDRSFSPLKLSKRLLLFFPNEANGLRLRNNGVDERDDDEDDDVLDKDEWPTEPENQPHRKETEI